MNDLADGIEQLEVFPYTEITELVELACKELKSGELLQHDTFHLRDAMTAIEIMDPRMDSGMLRNEPEEQRDDFKISDSLSNADIYLNMAQMMTCFFSWLRGDTMAQTLWTNLLAHNPDAIPHDILRSFHLGVRSLVVMICEIVTISHVSFEEDFSVDAAGVFLPNKPEETVIKELKDIVGQYGKKTSNDLLLSAIIFQLNIVISLIELLDNWYEGSLSANEVDRCLKMLRKNIESWVAASPNLPSLENSRIIGIDMNASRNLRMCVPPRPIKLFTLDETLNYLSKILDKLQKVNDLYSKNNIYSFDNLLDFLIRFTSDSVPVVVRSILQLWINRGELVFGEMAARDMIYKSLQSLCGFTFPSESETQATKLVNEFLNNFARVWSDLVRIFCFNEGRQPRVLYKMVTTFDYLQGEAEKSDFEIYNAHNDVKSTDMSDVPFYMAAWVYHYKLKLMKLIFEMGFSLELYNFNELPCVYWYMSYLCSCQYENLSRCFAYRNLRFKSPADKLNDTVSLSLVGIEEAVLKATGFFIFSIQAGKQAASAANISRFSSQCFHYRIQKFFSLSSPAELDFEDFEKDHRIESLEYLLKNANSVLKRAKAIVLSQLTTMKNAKHFEDKSIVFKSILRSIVKLSVGIDRVSAIVPYEVEDRSTSALEIGPYENFAESKIKYLAINFNCLSEEK